MKLKSIIKSTVFLALIYTFIVHPLYAYFVVAGGLIEYFITFAIYAGLANIYMTKVLDHYIPNVTVDLSKYKPKKQALIPSAIIAAVQATNVNGSFAFFNHPVLMFILSFSTIFSTLFLGSGILSEISKEYLVSNKWKKYLAVISILYVILHIHFMSTPLMVSWLDEANHIDKPVDFARFFFEFDELDSWGEKSLKEYEHYGPLGTPLYAIFMFIFGYDVMSFRSVQLAATIMTAFLIFELVKKRYSQRVAFASASSYLFFPAVFFFAGRAMLPMTLVLITTLALYYILEFLDSDSPKHLIISSLFVGLGYFYRRQALLMIPVVIFYLIVRWKKDVSKFIPFFSISPVLIAPFLVVKQILNRNSYGALTTYLVAPWDAMETHYNIIDEFARHRMSFYIEALPYQASPIIALLFGIGLIYSWKKKDEFTKFCYSMILFWWTFFSLNYVQVGRYTLPLMPLVAMFAYAPFEKTFSKTSLKKYGLIMATVLIFLSAVSLSESYHAEPKPVYYIGSPVASVDVISLPLDDAIKYLKEENAQNVLSYGTMFGYYSRKNNFSFNQTIMTQKMFQIEATELHKFCQENNFEYVIFPVGKKFYFNDDRWAIPQEKLKLSMESEEELFEINTFYYGDNKLLVAKVRD